MTCSVNTHKHTHTMDLSMRPITISRWKWTQNGLPTVKDWTVKCGTRSTEKNTEPSDYLWIAVVDQTPEQLQTELCFKGESDAENC